MVVSYGSSATLTFEEAGPIVDESLVFFTKALSFKDYIGLQAIMKNDIINNYDEVSVEAVVNSVDGTVTTSVISGRLYATKYTIFEQPVLSWDMTDVVSLTIHATKNGVEYVGEIYTSSVADLAIDKIKSYAAADNEPYARVLVDMLNYGAQVQTAYSHKTEKLANADLGDLASWGTSAVPTINATNSYSGTGSVAVNVNNISMQSKVEIQFAFKSDVSAYELRYTVNGETVTIPYSEFEPLGSYMFVGIAVLSANMRDVYTVALYNPATDEPVTPVYSVSVEGYATSKIANGTNVSMFQALMMYGDSVAEIA